MQKKVSEKGLAFLEQGNLSAARIIFNTLLAEGESSADCYHILAVIDLQDAKYQNAKEKIFRAIELDPKVGCFHNTLANIFLKTEQHDEALQSFITAIELEPLQLDYRHNLTNFLLSTNRTAEAIYHYEELLKVSPNDYDALRGITISYFCSGYIREALVWAKSWIEQHASSDETWYYYGLCHYGLQEYKSALKAFDHALKINPHNTAVLTATGVVFKEERNFKLAESYFLQSLYIDNNNPNTLYHLGLLRFSEGLISEAYDLFFNSINIDDQFAEPIYGIGLISKEQGNYDKAIYYFTIAEQLDPSFYEAREELTHTALLVRQLKEGWRYFSELHGIDQLTDEELDLFINTPMWKGNIFSQDLLIWHGNLSLNEQILMLGIIGDVIAKAKNKASITLQIDPKLASLVSRSYPGIRVITDLLQEDLREIKLQSNLAGLGKLFRIKEKQFKEQDYYLEADHMLSAHFQNKYHELFPHKLKVGICWQERNHLQVLDQFSDIFLNGLFNCHTELQLISLQTGPYRLKPEQNEKLYYDLEVNAAKEIDLLAAQISGLDLVITVDSYIAHLAGALGIRAHVILDRTKNWYWFNGKFSSTTKNPNKQQIREYFYKNSWYTNLLVHNKNKLKLKQKSIDEFIQKLLHT